MRVFLGGGESGEVSQPQHVEGPKSGTEPEQQQWQRWILNSLSHQGTPKMSLFCLFRATASAYGSSQARGPTVAAAAGLCHGCSNAGSLTQWVGPGIEPVSSWILVGFVTTEPQRELPEMSFKFMQIYTEKLPVIQFKTKKQIQSKKKKKGRRLRDIFLKRMYRWLKAHENTTRLITREM